jgi:epoxyqueuosine reductase QueG
MTEFLGNILKQYKVDTFAPIPLKNCKIVRPYLLENVGISNGTAFIIAVPYYSASCDKKRNISAYAVSRDYHLFFKILSNEILPFLQKEYKNNKFAFFADHSPINEPLAAAAAGIGILGDNGMLITHKYSSFVFLGEIITDFCESCNVRDIITCEKCGKCKAACPIQKNASQCISALTQKKGVLSSSEEKEIKKYGCAWGCDICQEVCPHTIKAKSQRTIYSNIDFFNEHTKPFLKKSDVENMSDQEFNERAYSWRGRQTIVRNLELLERCSDFTSEKE